MTKDQLNTIANIAGYILILNLLTLIILVYWIIWDSSSPIILKLLGTDLLTIGLIVIIGISAHNAWKNK